MLNKNSLLKALASIAFITALSVSAETVNLTDLTWDSETATHWLARINANCEGRPLEVDGIVRTNSIGTHADAEIVYSIGGYYKTLEMGIGLDDYSCRGTDCKVIYSVFGDDQLLFESRELHQIDKVENIVVPVEGVQTLRLEARGVDNAVSKSCAFVNPVLVEADNVTHITGRFMNSSNNNPYANVKLEYSGINNSKNVAYSDADGYFDITGLMGECTVKFSHPYYGEVTETYNVQTPVYEVNFEYSNLPFKREKVALVVDNEINAKLYNEIETYINDVEKDFPVEIYKVGYKNLRKMHPDTIRAGLKYLYDNESIKGAIFVGYTPMYRALYDRTYNKYTETSLPYEDLDANFKNENCTKVFTDHNAKYDIYDWGSTDPDDQTLEIWVSYIRPYQSTEATTVNATYGTAQVEQLRSWFNKTHKYYTGNMVYRKRAQIFAADEYAIEGTENDPKALELKEIYGEENVDLYNERYAAHNWYLERLVNGYEINILYSHSGAQGHYVTRGPRPTITSDPTYDEFNNNIGNGGIVNLLFACEAAHVDISCGGRAVRNQALSYSMEGNGMAAIATARSIDPKRYDVVLSNLKKHMFLGDAYKAHKEFYLREFIEGREPVGLLFFGNPFIYTHKYHNLSAAPSSISGYVTNESGVTVKKGKAYIFQGKKSKGIADVNSDGSFVIDNIKAGTYDITVVDSSGTETKSTVNVGAGQTNHSQYVINNYKSVIAPNSKWYYNFTKFDSDISANWKKEMITKKDWGYAIAPYTVGKLDHLVETGVWTEVKGEAPEVKLPLGSNRIKLTLYGKDKMSTDEIIVYVAKSSDPLDAPTKLNLHNPVGSGTFVADAGPAEELVVDHDGDGFVSYRLDGSNSVHEEHADFVWSWGLDLSMKNEFDLTATDGVILNISAENPVEIYVNETLIEMSPVQFNRTRPNLKYWNMGVDISSACREGKNFISIFQNNTDGGRYLDANIIQLEK